MVLVPQWLRPGAPRSLGNHEARIRALERRAGGAPGLRYDFDNEGDWLNVGTAAADPNSGTGYGTWWHGSVPGGEALLGLTAAVADGEFNVTAEDIEVHAPTGGDPDFPFTILGLKTVVDGGSENSQVTGHDVQAGDGSGFETVIGIKAGVSTKNLSTGIGLQAVVSGQSTINATGVDSRVSEIDEGNSDSIGIGGYFESKMKEGAGTALQAVAEIRPGHDGSSTAGNFFAQTVDFGDAIAILVQAKTTGVISPGTAVAIRALDASGAPCFEVRGDGTVHILAGGMVVADL